MRLRAFFCVVIMALLVATAFAHEEPAEVQAVAFLHRWLLAQNDADFVAYQAMYAHDFSGVRRVGAQSETLNRAGWLRDRRRDFEKRMIAVAVQNTRVYVTSRLVLVSFTERRSSQERTESDPKSLLLRRSASGFRIVSERPGLDKSHSASSAVPPARALSAPLDATGIESFMFVVDNEVVLSREPEEAWSSGPPEIQKQSGTRDSYLAISRRAVDHGKLPAEIARLKGRDIHLMDAGGVLCDARIGEFFIRGRVLTNWSPNAAQLWDMSAHFLVATITSPKGRCSDATWARSADLPVVPTVAAGPVTPELTTRVLSAFDALPVSQDIQRRMSRRLAGRSSKGMPLMWYRAQRAKLSMRALDAGPTGPRFVSVSASIGADPADERSVSGSVWALWQLEGPTGRETLTLRSRPNVTTTLTPTGLIDFGGRNRFAILFDGVEYVASTTPGMFIEHGVVQATDSRYVEVSGPEIPVVVCPL